MDFIRQKIPEKITWMPEDILYPVGSGLDIKFCNIGNKHMVSKHDTGSSGPTDKYFLRMKDLRKLTGLSPSYLYLLSAEGRFPRSVPLVPGGTARAWLYEEVMDWLEGRVSERDMEVRYECTAYDYGS
jgi:prophage regulatory protein